MILKRTDMMRKVSSTINCLGIREGRIPKGGGGDAPGTDRPLCIYSLLFVDIAQREMDATCRERPALILWDSIYYHSTVNWIRVLRTAVPIERLEKRKSFLINILLPSTYCCTNSLRLDVGICLIIPTCDWKGAGDGIASRYQKSSHFSTAHISIPTK